MRGAGRSDSQLRGNDMNSLLQLLGNHGLAIAFVNVLLVQLGLPIPAYPALIVTGALIAEQRRPARRSCSSSPSPPA